MSLKGRDWIVRLFQKKRACAFLTGARKKKKNLNYYAEQHEGTVGAGGRDLAGCSRI